MRQQEMEARQVGDNKHGQATISCHWNWNLRREQKVAGTEGCPREGEEGQGIQTARPGAGGPDGPHQHALWLKYT